MELEDQGEEMKKERNHIVCSNCDRAAIFVTYVIMREKEKVEFVSSSLTLRQTTQPTAADC